MIPLRAVMLGVLTQGMPRLEQDGHVRRPGMVILPMPRSEIKRLRKENLGYRKALDSQRFEFGTVFCDERSISSQAVDHDLVQMVGKIFFNLLRVLSDGHIRHVNDLFREIGVNDLAFRFIEELHQEERQNVIRTQVQFCLRKW